MYTPFFVPPPRFTGRLILRRPRTVRELCALVGVPCRGSGEWTNRLVEVRYGSVLTITALPGDWGSVVITAPVRGVLAQSQLALYLLAYALHDLVAKESIRTTKLAQISPPKGRPRRTRPQSNAERQRRFRERQRSEY